MIKINAADRLKVTAATASNLYKWLISLSPDQVMFFYNDLPRLMDDWFSGASSAGKKSEHLPISFASTVEARKYFKSDAIAVAFGHLKSLYPPQIKAPIQRSLLMPKNTPTPNTKIVNFKSTDKWRPLQSWTYLETPVVNDRDFNGQKQYDLVLSMEPSVSKSVVVTDYIQLNYIAQDAVAVREEVENYFSKKIGKDDSIYLEKRHWHRVQDAIKSFKNEREVWVYVPAGKPLKCKWRIVRGTPAAPSPAPSTEPGGHDLLSYFKQAGKPVKVKGHLYFTVGKATPVTAQVVKISDIDKGFGNAQAAKIQVHTFRYSEMSPIYGKKFKAKNAALIQRYLSLTK